MSKELFLPTLPHWEFGNNWSGSCGTMRFFITTSEVEEDGAKRKQMMAEVWNEDVCRELAAVLDSRCFLCTREGLEEMRSWLLEKAEELG